MIKRSLQYRLAEVIARVPAVVLLGPRQVGKTTLAHTIGRDVPSLYLDLESPGDLLKLSDPLSYLQRQSDRLVIIDEMQRFPDLFPVLRGLIDQHRRDGRRGEQFLLLGSASMELMRQMSESLAGRIHFEHLQGIHLLEWQSFCEGGAGDLWLRGGYPDGLLAGSDEESADWLEMLIRTYLERDLSQFGFRVSATRMRRLWTMLAHLQGETINCSKLAGNLEIDGKTVAHYLDILVDLLLVRRLQPYHANVKKRLVKSPRFYIRDSGILHRLLSIESPDALLSNPVLGKSWEGFVIENILALVGERAESFYYRTQSGAEIDLLLRFSSNDLWAVAIKYGVAPKISTGFHRAAADVGATRKLVVYGGDDEFPIGNETTVVSLAGLMRMLPAGG